MDLIKMLATTVGRLVDETAIIMKDNHVSFAQIEADSNRVANALISLGIKKGDRVATIQGSNPEFVIIFFGILKAGGIVVPLDSRYVVDELQNIFNDCHPRALVIEDPLLESLLPELSGFKSIEHIITVNTEHDERFTSYREIIEKYSPERIDTPINPQDPAIISYTSGPTRKPHGVVLSHESLCTEAVNSAGEIKQTERDVMMQFALPMYHQFGLTAVMLASIYTGNKLVLVPGTGRSIHSFMEAVEREKGTIYMGVPYIYSLMINVARREGIRHDLSSLRLCISGGAPLETAIIHLFKKWYGLNIIDVYGQTETICHITMMPMDGSGKAGASGKALPCWEIKIFDDNDNELTVGQEGEIVTRGPMMTGFYNKPQETAKVIKNGWLHTRDIGKLDENGLLYITGRKRRMLILKGQNIFPDDIEEVLTKHPKIAEVRILGTIDLIRGETVKALVKLKPEETADEQEIRQYCQGRMADYKLPREVEFVDVMPEVIPLWERPKNLKLADLTAEGTG